MLPKNRRAATLLPLMSMVLVGATACSYLRTVTGIGFERPTLTYESWSPEQLDLDGVTVALHYRLENPNDFAIDLRELDYRLDIEGAPVADGKLPQGLQIQAHGATAVALPIRVLWNSIPNLAELMLTRNTVAYRVSGNAGVGSTLGTVMLPFEHSDHLALPRPSIRFGGDSSR